MRQITPSSQQNSWYWRAIQQLDRPRGRIILTSGISLSFTLLALLQTAPVVYAIVAVLFTVIAGFTQFSLDQLKIRHQKQHYARVQGLLLPLLQRLHRVLLPESENAFQSALMLYRPDQGGEWFTAIQHNLKLSKDQIVISDRQASWLTWVQADHSSPMIEPVREAILQLVFKNPLERQCFYDVREIMLVPIYRPDSEHKRADLLGILVVYSEVASNHEQNRKILTVIAERIAPILCYDCLCLS
jgi:hypothetical protein